MDEYRKYIEKDAALERRFQPVLVTEPTVADTISILRGLKERYEVFHGVKIQDSALIAAATLSNRYISDRFLPDKAIDLVDEACAMIRTEIDSLPTELDEVSRRVMQLEIEQAALKKEEDEAGKRRLEVLEAELARQRRLSPPCGPAGKTEGRHPAVQKLREDIERVNAEIAKAEASYDLGKAARAEIRRTTQASGGAGPAEAEAEREQGKTAAAGQGHRGGDQPHRQPLDRHPRYQAQGKREGKAADLARGAPPPGGGPGGGGPEGQRGHPAQPGRHRRREPPHRQLPVFGPHRRGQDRAGQGPGPKPL